MWRRYLAYYLGGVEYKYNGGVDSELGCCADHRRRRSQYDNHRLVCWQVCLSVCLSVSLSMSVSIVWECWTGLLSYYQLCVCVRKFRLNWLHVSRIRPTHWRLNDDFDINLRRRRLTRNIFTGCGIIKQSPKKTGISRKWPGIFCCIFHQLMARYISLRYINFITILRPQTKLWLCKVPFCKWTTADQFNYKKSILF